LPPGAPEYCVVTTVYVLVPLPEWHLNFHNH
jgi:hypothetical protein